ncbi:MAG: 3-oxoacyl-ACP reductase FabG [Magnetovibrio sp.]|nr:3-oxoacyl-ACP reductase FabG [Magnetovibrio sp.]
MQTQKRALITGASGSLGQAMCRALAKDGYYIIAHANSNPDAAKALVTDLHKEGHQATTITFDVTDAQACQNALAKMLDDGPIQTVVSNAGVHDDAPMAGMSADQWNRVIDVSLNGFFNVVQPLLLPMMKTRWGRVVAISSVSGLIGNRGQANYAAAKAGLHGAVKSLSLEYASRGITANAVAPGIIATPETESLFSAGRLKDLVPMQRAGTPEDVASTVQFLTSDKSSYISGQIISVNGGMA